ncbi:hypothetical protein [Fibrella arboris]|uniref:hypothetical protein n=1 Tax=Fibrella arboris TaxID=3242486 RepID=UPI00351FE5CC
MSTLRSMARTGLSVVLFVGISAFFAGCRSADPDVTPEKTDEFISCKINGVAYSSYNASSLGDDSYFYLWGLLPLTSSANSQLYSIKVSADNPKAGVFTAQKGGLSVEFGLIKSFTSVDDYTVPTSTGNSLTISLYDPEGYAEGTFMFTGRTSTGQPMTVSEGKFRIDLR